MPTKLLYEAAGSASAAEFKKLIQQHRILVNAAVEDGELSGRTPLHNAAKSAKSGNIKVLLAAGARVDAADSSGWTALMDAAMAGSEGCVRALLEAGASTAVADECHQTALMAAAFKRSKGAVRALLEAGASVNAAATNHGWTALHYAASTGFIAVIDVLVAAGADLTAYDHDGRTPRDVALERNKTHASRVLLELEQQQAAQPGATSGRAAANSARPASALREPEHPAAGAAGGEAAEPRPATAGVGSAPSSTEGAAVDQAAGEAAAAAPQEEPSAARGEAAAHVFGPDLCGKPVRVWWPNRQEWVDGTIIQCTMPDRVHCVEFEGVGLHWRMQLLRLQHERFQLLGEDGQVQAEYRAGLLVQQEGKQEQAAGDQQQQVVQRTGSRGSGERNPPGAGEAAASGQRGHPASSVAAAAAAAAELRRLRQQPATAVAAGPAASTARGMPPPPPQEQQRGGKRQQQQEQPAAKRQRQVTAAQAAEREYAALQRKAFDAAELGKLVCRYLAPGEKQTEAPLALRSGGALPRERVTRVPPAVQSWGSGMGMSAEALDELWSLLGRHQAGDAEASHRLLFLLRVLECWLTHRGRPQPEVLVRLRRPLGWQPPPLPSVSGVEIVSQGAAGSDKPEPSFSAGAADGEILGVRVAKEDDQRWNVKQEVQHSG